MSKIKVLLTEEDNTILDEFKVWEADRPERTAIELSQRVRDYIERRYDVEEES